MRSEGARFDTITMQNQYEETHWTLSDLREILVSTLEKYFKEGFKTEENQDDILVFGSMIVEEFIFKADKPVFMDREFIKALWKLDDLWLEKMWFKQEGMTLLPNGKRVHTKEGIDKILRSILKRLTNPPKEEKDRRVLSILLKQPLTPTKKENQK